MKLSRGKEQEEKITGVGETYLVMGLIICMLHILGCQIKGDEMAGGCSACKKDEKCM